MARKNSALLWQFVRAYELKRNGTMLRWTLIFLVIAIIAGIFGFTGISEAAAGVAKVLFFIFIVLFVLSLLFGAKLLGKK
jgi:uncharacterized membrane protein YtjA (UPF0391 family)